MWIRLKKKNRKEVNNMVKEIYNVDDVARYVINYSNICDYSISNLKLQKILYFIQAKFLNENDYPCFVEEIEAWSFGPVVPQVYREYKEYGAGHIPYIEKYYCFGAGLFDFQVKKYDDNIICNCDKEKINDMIDECSQYSATDLVNITHKQAPWVDAYVPYLNKIITKDSIKKYFRRKNGH